MALLRLVRRSCSCHCASAGWCFVVVTVFVFCLPDFDSIGRSLVHVSKHKQYTPNGEVKQNQTHKYWDNDERSNNLKWARQFLGSGNSKFKHTARLCVLV